MCDLLRLCAVQRGGKGSLSTLQMPTLIVRFRFQSWPQVPFVLLFLILAVLWRALHAAGSVSWAAAPRRALSFPSWSSVGNYSGNHLSFLLNLFLIMVSRTKTRDLNRLEVENKKLLLLLSRWSCAQIMQSLVCCKHVTEKGQLKASRLGLISDLDIQKVSGSMLCCQQWVRSLQCRQSM